MKYKWKFVTVNEGVVFITAETMKDAINRLPDDVDFIRCRQVENSKWLRVEES